MSESVQPHRRQPTRLHHPWDSPGKNTGVGCHFLLQCMKVKSESEVFQLCPTLSDPMDCSLPGSSVHGIFQARLLEWVAIAFSINLVYLPLLNFAHAEVLWLWWTIQKCCGLHRKPDERSYPTHKVRDGDLERQAVTVQKRPRGAIPRPKSRAAAKRSYPTSKERRLHG